jgi:hypothetical protein
LVFAVLVRRGFASSPFCFVAVLLFAVGCSRFAVRRQLMADG